MANPFAVPFVTNDRLTAIARVYKNDDYIADEVLPRVPVDTPSFLYSVFNKTDFFTIPDTRVSRTSLVNQIDWSATQASASVEDFALEELIPLQDQRIAAAYGNVFNLKATATEQVTEGMLIAHEARVANLVFNPATYPAGNKTAIANGTAQWSDPASDPLSQMQDAIDTMYQAPNTLVIGKVVANKLKRNITLNKQLYGENNARFSANLQDIANELGLDAVIVGESRATFSKKGQDPVLTRLWGNFAALIYRAPVSINTRSFAFGITAEFDGRTTDEYFDPNRGRKGSDVIRVGESNKPLILAPDAGYLFSNVVA